MARKRDTKPTVKRGVLRVRAYPVLGQAVEDGVGWGWMHAYKHRDDEPAEAVRDAVCNQIVEDVMSAVCEAFDFPDDSEPDNG